MKRVKKDYFGEFDGKEITLYTLETDSGYQLKIMPYGATIIEYNVFDKELVRQNIVLRFADFNHYIQNSPKLGSVVGPVAGRIADGRFTLNGKTYQLPQNNGAHHLHGGETGFADTLFDIVEVSDSHITFYTKRVDGTGGYPGEVAMWVTYTLDEAGRVTMNYRVTSNKETLMNPTNHTYFNLSGSDMDPIDDTIVKIQASHYIETTDELIPTGKMLEDAEFFKALQQGVSLSRVFSVINGLDHAFVLNESTNVVELYLEKNGIHLTIDTQSPAIVVYTANGYNQNEHHINGKVPFAHNGIALETQILPDAIHHKDFGQIVLSPHKTFETTTSFWATVK